MDKGTICHHLRFPPCLHQLSSLSHRPRYPPAVFPLVMLAARYSSEGVSIGGMCFIWTSAGPIALEDCANLSSVQPATIPDILSFKLLMRTITDFFHYCLSESFFVLFLNVLFEHFCVEMVLRTQLARRIILKRGRLSLFKFVA